MKKIICLILMMVLILPQIIFAQDTNTQTPTAAQPVSQSQPDTKLTEVKEDTLKCLTCGWVGPRLALINGKCPKCGSTKLVVLKEIDIQEAERIQKEQQQIQQLNQQQNTTSVQNSVESIRKINEFNQQQKAMQDINNINRTQKTLDDIKKINEQNQRR